MSFASQDRVDSLGNGGWTSAGAGTPIEGTRRRVRRFMLTGFVARALDGRSQVPPPAALPCLTRRSIQLLCRAFSCASRDRPAFQHRSQVQRFTAIESTPSAGGSAWPAAGRTRLTFGWMRRGARPLRQRQRCAGPRRRVQAERAVVSAIAVRLKAHARPCPIRREVDHVRRLHT